MPRTRQPYQTTINASTTLSLADLEAIKARAQALGLTAPVLPRWLVLGNFPAEEPVKGSTYGA